MLDIFYKRNIKNVTYYGYDKYNVKNVIFVVNSRNSEFEELLEDLKELHKLSNSKDYFSNKCCFDIETDEGNITVSWYDQEINIGVGLWKLH